jgi:hypothetical protein
VACRDRHGQSCQRFSAEKKQKNSAISPRISRDKQSVHRWQEWSLWSGRSKYSGCMSSKEYTSVSKFGPTTFWFCRELTWQNEIVQGKMTRIADHQRHGQRGMHEIIFVKRAGSILTCKSRMLWPGCMRFKVDKADVYYKRWLCSPQLQSTARTDHTVIPVSIANIV